MQARTWKSLVEQLSVWQQGGSCNRVLELEPDVVAGFYNTCNHELRQDTGVWCAARAWKGVHAAQAMKVRIGIVSRAVEKRLMGRNHAPDQPIKQVVIPVLSDGGREHE
jgi:hypothetical protein